MRGEAQVLAGRYLLGDRLGEGGSGTVWRARDEMLNRDVAVKQVRIPGGLPPHERAGFVDRAMHEARAAARLRDRAIVMVHDVVLDHGQPWIIMDLSTGQSLDRMIKQSGPLPRETVARIGLQVLSALEVAHAHGMLHQDVKPANILLDADGQAMLTDFGIATPVGGQGQLFGSAGSPGYMAPERLNGQPSGAHSDLWSLGASLYTLVEGRAPFQRDLAAAVVAAVLMQEPPFPARAGRDLGALLMDMLAKDPARRPTAAEVRRRLAVPTPVSQKGRRWLIPVAALAAVVLGAGGWYGFAVLNGPDPAAAGRFATAPDPCGLLSDAQAAALLKGEVRRSKPKADECRWEHSKGPDILGTIRVTMRVELPRQGRSAPDIAALVFTTERDNRKSSEGGAFGVTTGKVADLPGVGEAAFAENTANDKVNDEGANVVFRVSNLIAEVKYRAKQGKTGQEELRASAVTAARQVSSALTR